MSKFVLRQMRDVANPRYPPEIQLPLEGIVLERFYESRLHGKMSLKPRQDYVMAEVHSGWFNITTRGKRAHMEQGEWNFLYADDRIRIGDGGAYKIEEI